MNHTQSQVALATQFRPVIVDDATEDNSLYYEMVEEEKRQLLEEDKYHLQEEREFKRDYINSLFDEE